MVNQRNLCVIMLEYNVHVLIKIGKFCNIYNTWHEIFLIAVRKYTGSVFILLKTLLPHHKLPILAFLYLK